MGILSRAQNFEDVMLWRALGCVENGFFIDIGAQHPIKDSVSKVFSEHGWRGIHVDPVPEYASLLREDRPGDIVIQAAVSDQAGLVNFFAIPQTGLSTGNAEIASAHEAAGYKLNEIAVPTVSLDELFELANCEVHWLKIDVEGMEANVLNSWRQSRCRPWIVLIEATLPGSPVESHENWEQLILAKYYAPVYFDGLNRFYVSDEHPELAKSFYAPPNVYDGFQLDTLSDHAIELQRSYGAQIEALSHDVTRLEGDLAHLHRSHEASREEWETTTERRLAELTSELSATFEAQREIVQQQAADQVAEARKDEQLRAADTLANALEAERASAAAAREDDQHRFAGTLAKALEEAALAAESVRKDDEARAADNLARSLTAERVSADAKLNEAIGRERMLAKRIQDERDSCMVKLQELQQQFESLLKSAKKAKSELAETKMEFRVQSAAAEADRQQERTVHMAKLAEEALRLEFAEHRALTLEGALAQVKQELSELRRKADRNATRLAAKIIAVTEDLALIKQERLYLERQLANEAESARMAQADARNALIKVQEDLAESIDKAERQRDAHRAAVAALSDRHNDVISNQAARHHEEMSRLQAARDNDASAHAAQICEIEAREARQAGEIAQRSADLATFQAENIRLADELKRSNADKQTLIAQFDSEISRIISDSASRESLLRSDCAESKAVIEQIMQERDGLRSSLHTLEDQAGVQQRLLQETVQVLSSQPNHAVTRSRRLVSAMAALFGRTRSAADQEFFTSLNQVNETIANFIESGHGRLNALTIGLDRSHAGQKSLRELAMLVDESPITDMPRLLALHDVTFVKAAYQALLGRSPDEDGLNYYINRIRLGIHKLEILRQLRSSPEGRSFIPSVSGLDRAIKRHRLSTLPVLGALVRPFSGLSSNSANNQYLRSLANSIGRLQNEQLEVSRNTDGLVEKVNLIISKLCEIDRSVCAVRDTTEWVGAHLDQNLPRGDLQASNSNSQFVGEPDRPTEVETKNNTILSVVDTRPTRPLPEHAIRVFSQLR